MHQGEPGIHWEVGDGGLGNLVGLGCQRVRKKDSQESILLWLVLICSMKVLTVGAERRSEKRQRWTDLVHLFDPQQPPGLRGPYVRPPMLG